MTLTAPSPLQADHGLDCPPRFGTQRDYSRQTLGPAIGEVARRLGKPFMPWQQYVADVLGEIDPATGQLHYDEGDITVPRQSGKTTFKLAKAAHRCTAAQFFGPRQHVVYTAQTRKDARKKFEEEFVPDLLASPTFRGRVKPHWGNGNEHITFRNGSRWGIEATTEKAGHGGVVDEAHIDEAFAQIDNRLEVAFDPAMITRANKQLLVVSTAGWLDASPYLWGKVEVGRQMIELGRPTRTAYFEWSADDDADPGDEAVWWGCMPALGFTITVAAIQSAYDKAVRNGDLNGFRRSYLNIWVPKDAPDEACIDPEAWAELTDREDVRPSPVSFSVVVSEDRKWSSIGLAGKRTDGRDHVQIIKAGRGTKWVAAELVELVGKWKPGWVALRSNGPEGSLIQALEDENVPVLKVGAQDAAQACGLFADAIEEATLAHTGQPQVAVAIAAADKRQSGQTFTWKSKNGSDISPLWALTLALHASGKPSKSTRSGLVYLG